MALVLVRDLADVARLQGQEKCFQAFSGNYYSEWTDSVVLPAAPMHHRQCIISSTLNLILCLQCSHYVYIVPVVLFNGRPQWSNRLEVSHLKLARTLMLGLWGFWPCILSRGLFLYGYISVIIFVLTHRYVQNVPNQSALTIDSCLCKPVHINRTSPATAYTTTTKSWRVIDHARVHRWWSSCPGL